MEPLVMFDIAKLVEVAACNEVLPVTVREEFALMAPPTFKIDEMVVEPVTASAVEVAPLAVRPPLNWMRVEVAFAVAPPKIVVVNGNAKFA